MFRFIKRILGIGKPLTALEALQQTAARYNNPKATPPGPLPTFPAADASIILSAFAVGETETDVDLHELEDLLAKAGRDVVVDWRSSLQDITPAITDVLKQVGIDATVNLYGEDLNEARIEIAGDIAVIRYIASEEDDFDTVIQTVNSLISTNASFRKYCSCEGTDGWAYTLLSNDAWATIDSRCSGTTRAVFETVRAA